MKHKKLDLVILAGGRGSRIKKITNKIPKPMIRFGDVPFLKFLINYYAKFNFEKIYILGGYKNEIIKKYFKKIARVNSVEIKVLDEPKPLGTGGALNILKKRSINDFFLINGDSYFEISNKEFLKMQATNKIGSLLLIKNENYKSNKKLANLKVNKGKISKKGNLMNSGIYFFKKKILKQIPLKPFSLENDFLEGKIIYNKINLLINKKKKFFIDIGTYKNYFGAKKNLKNKLIQPAIFFDRDGVINKLKPYVGNMKRFELNKNIFKTFEFLNKKKIFIFIVTNQAGIAKGYYTEKEYLRFEKKIKLLFYKNNLFINDVKYCPFHPKGTIKRYIKNSNYRKPGNFMIRDLLNEWPINLQKSIMIGDQITDKKSAKSINLKFQYVQKDIFLQVKSFFN